jgi:hypothetical protein
MENFVFADHVEFLRLMALSEPRVERAAMLMAAANYMEFLETSILEELDDLFTQLRVDE